VTSLKAYRVEFIEPLTESPGTENERGEHQNAVVSCRLLVTVVKAVESQNVLNFLHQICRAPVLPIFRGADLDVCGKTNSERKAEKVHEFLDGSHLGG
jgi:hypothetical protein